MSESLNKITVRAPATTANMGPGFDSLGMALEVFNTISIERSDQFSIRITGNGAVELSTGPDNMVYRGVAAVYSAAGAELPPLAVACHNEIPLRRGLGSSAAAIAGGMVAANLILGGPLPLEELLRLADAIEGPPRQRRPRPVRRLSNSHPGRRAAHLRSLSRRRRPQRRPPGPRR